MLAKYQSNIVILFKNNGAGAYLFYQSYFKVRGPKTQAINL